jgi:hypothetical protein
VTATPGPGPTPAPAPPAEAPAARTPPPRTSSFTERYTAARTHLVTGDFAEAAAGFADAERYATDPTDAELSHQLRLLALEWAQRGLAFVQKSAIEGTELSAAAVDRRSTGSIVGLYATAVLYGAGSGLWIDVVASSSSTGAVVLPPLLGAGAAVGLVAALDSGRGLRYGTPAAIESGLLIGGFEGTAWTLWRSQNADGGWSAPAATSFIWASSTLGGVAGAIAGEAVGTTPGRASFVSSSALWSGIVLGLATGAFTNDNNNNPGAEIPFAVAAIAPIAGTVLGALTASSVSPSAARIGFIDLGGLSGFLVGGGLYLAIANNNTDLHALSGSAALGTAAGLGIAWFATRSMAKDQGPQQKTPATTFQPTISPMRGGAALGLGGLF